MSCNWSRGQWQPPNMQRWNAFACWGPQGGGMGHPSTFEAARGAQGRVPQSSIIPSLGARRNSGRLVGGWSLPAGNLRLGFGRRKPMDCGVREPRSMGWSMGIMLCPHISTTLLSGTLGAEVLRGTLLQFWGP